MRSTLILPLENHDPEATASLAKKSKIYKYQPSVDNQLDNQDSEQDVDFPSGLITLY